MKLEIPNQRIMSGEAATLSATACKTLLILLSFQDQHTNTITISKETIAKKSGLSRRTIYNAIDELEQQHWITRNRQIIQIVQHQTLHKSIGDDTCTISATNNAKSCTQSAKSCTQSASADTHRSEDIEDIDHMAKICNTIAEYYNMTPSDTRRLWSTLQNKDLNKIKKVFQSMKNTRVKDPISYLSVSLRSASLEAEDPREKFRAFLYSLPDLE